MTDRTKTKQKIADVDAGWIDLYEAGSEGVPTWSETPPPFLDALKPHLPPGSSALETCCGDGRITQALVSWGINVTALDLSNVALTQLAGAFRQRGLRPPLMVVGSATDVPLGDAQFDAVVCINGFCQLDRPDVAVREVARVLRPGGKFLVDIFTPQDAAFGVGEQIAAQDFLYRGTLFRFFTAEQFAGIYEGVFRVVEMFETTWMDPPHGNFRPEKHLHAAVVYVFEKREGEQN